MNSNGTIRRVTRTHELLGVIAVALIISSIFIFAPIGPNPRFREEIANAVWMVSVAAPAALGLMLLRSITWRR